MIKVGHVYCIKSDTSDPVRVTSYVDGIVEFVYLRQINGITNKRKHTDKLFSRVYMECKAANILFGDN